MATALIPLAGLVGGGIDINPVYITKTRLHHACYADTCAGRPAIGCGHVAPLIPARRYRRLRNLKADRGK